MYQASFVTRNNDLIIMFLAGLGIQSFSNVVLPLTVQSQFLLVLSFSFLAGFFLKNLAQSIEWAILFSFGVLLSSMAPLLILFFSHKIQAISLIQNLIETSRFNLFLLSSWIIGIPVGYFFRHAFIGDYYRRDIF